MTTVFITGGARGIGLELAKAYLAAGETVLLGLRQPAKAPAAVAGCELYPLDVASGASVKALASRLGERAIDVLINNAGIIGPDRQSAVDMDFEGFLETLQVNTLGPLRVTQALLPNLRRSRSGRVVVISSRMGSMAYAKSDHLAYRASKTAANKIVQGLATDLAAEGIAVAAAHPGWVRTDMGGAGADIAPQESARGLKVVIDGLTLANTGRFWNYNGADVPW